MKNILLYLVGIASVITVLYPFYIEYKIKSFFKKYPKLHKEANELGEKFNYRKTINNLKRLQVTISKEDIGYSSFDSILKHYKKSWYILWLTLFFVFLLYVKQ